MEKKEECPKCPKCLGELRLEMASRLSERYKCASCRERVYRVLPVDPQGITRAK